MNPAPNRTARIVIIGGGVIGCSIAYQLARAGERDVLLLEKAQLTEGCTWHAAGLVGQLRGKRNLTRLMQNSVAVYDRLAEEAGAAIDWKKVGSLRLASSPDRWSEIRRSMSQAKSFGVECHALSATEAKELFPYMTTDGVEGAAFIPSDGYVDPYALTHAYAKAARKYGAVLEEGVRVEDVIRSGRRIEAVVTDGGVIGCEILVNAAGLWAKRVADMMAVPLAAGVVEHQYFLTEKTLDFAPDLPTLRDPDHNFYLKPDTGAFAIGGWEDGSKGCWRGRPPFEFGRELFPENLERLERFAVGAIERLPVLNDTGVQTVINGPIPVSADGEPIMGAAPGLDNVFVACGFTSGVAASGGVGEAMANWILEGDPGMDLWAFDMRRFGAAHAQSYYLERLAIQAYGDYYKVHWPGEERPEARNLRRSPFFNQLESAGAVFGAKFGWERPLFFAPNSSIGARGRFEEKPEWFDLVGEEHRAIRERVALIDQTSFSKFVIAGPDAQASLQRIAANDLSGPPGKAVYTQLCNSEGGIEADVTLIHESEDRFLLVTGSGFGLRDSDWVRRWLPETGVEMFEVTNRYATLNIVGPHARDVLGSVTDDDLSNEGWPFLSARWIDVGLARALAARIGYVGELGYELYIPQEYAAHVYETLWRAGQGRAIANAGYRAIESCRLEKGYLYWSGDITPETNPYEAGLGFCVALDKPHFTGREALAAIKSAGVARRIASLTVDGFAPLHGGEPILSGGEVISETTSCGYGYSVGKTVALGYLPSDLSPGATLEIEAFGRIYLAARGPRCLYDPTMARLKA